MVIIMNNLNPKYNLALVMYWYHRHGGFALIRNPYTGDIRNWRDVKTDPMGTLIVAPNSVLYAAITGHSGEFET